MMLGTAAPPLQIPDGRHADLEEMQNFGETLETFIRQQEATLDSVDSDARHDEIVDFLNVLADSYNQQLRVFKACELARQQKLLIAMSQVLMED